MMCTLGAKIRREKKRLGAESQIILTIEMKEVDCILATGEKSQEIQVVYVTGRKGSQMDCGTVT
jgi:hypothetical protein